MGITNEEQAQIRFSTQIIKRLGEELNPSVEQSILELVKNSYDADAKNCTIILENVSDIGGNIKIIDDGSGMTVDTIKNGWLVLGESTKKTEIRTKLNRIPAGNKGLGRLAALRMGKHVVLESISEQNNKIRHELVINWEKFDTAKFVNDVSLPIKTTKNTSSVLHGSTIEIKDLNSKISERDLKKLAKGLILLSNPFEDDPNAFKPKLISNEFKEFETLVANRYFDDAEYHLNASINKNGFAEAVISDYKGNILFKADHERISKKREGKKYDCPPLTFNLWAFILNETSFSTRNTTINEVKQWLTEFGGVHLYENGLRVNPYGNPGNDWLEMNLSRAKSPEERPSTNTSIGIVRVLESNGLLSQKTDRSGFIENDVFHEIKQFCKDSLEWMAKERMDVAEAKRRAERSRSKESADQSNTEILTEINKLSPSRKRAVEKAFLKYKKTKEEEVKSLRKEIQLYRTLSTAGITAATFSHESRGNSIKTISLSINNINRRLKKYFEDYYTQHFEKPINSIIRSVNSLEVLSNATLSLIKHEKRRQIKVDIHQSIDEILVIFKPFFDGRDITVQKEFQKGNPYIRATVAALESIITNLLNNSINALENSTRQRIIKIKTRIEEKILIISVSDNGPGIMDINLKDIWLPGETTNPNGTGLGLTIVRDSVYDLGGRVQAFHKSELGGAEIIVEIPIIGI